MLSSSSSNKGLDEANVVVHTATLDTGNMAQNSTLGMERANEESEVCVHLSSKKKGNLDGFEFPWTAMDPDILDSLEKHQRILSIVTRAVERIIYEIRYQSGDPHILTPYFESVAKEMIRMYPDTFQDFADNGKCRGQGIASILGKLQPRNFYLNNISTYCIIV